MQPEVVSSQLHLCDVSLLVHLGCTVEERQRLQEVHFSIGFGFRESPPGEKTDSLSDTICYAEVTDKLALFLETREYQLVEAMAADCLAFLKEAYPGVLIQLCLHKLHPPLPRLKGGVKYKVGDRFV